MPLNNVQPINRKQKQAGVALLMVVFIVSLLSILVAYAMESQLLSVRRVTNQMLFEQSYQLAMGGEQWAISLLQNDMENPESAKTDHFGESWKDIQETVKVDVGEMKVAIEDVSGRLNLNSLFLDKNNIDTSSKKKTSQLPIEFISGVWILNNLLLALEEDTRLVGNLVDWLDTDDSDTTMRNPKTKQPLYTGGAEDFHYTGLEKPYRAANQKLKSLGELRFVKGFNEKIIKKLEPFVVVLPTNQLKININTASEELLLSMSNRALSPPANLTQVLEGQASPLGHENIAVISNGAKQAGWMPDVEKIIDVKSLFFRVTSKASFDELSYSMSSMLYRNFERADDGSLKPTRVVLRERKIL